MDELIVVERALARDKPCEIYSHRCAPYPSRTQGHHLYPVYLQKRLWGEVRLHDRVWACGLCHDSIHDWIDWQLGEARQPLPHPGRNHRRYAEMALEWYRAELDRVKTG